MEKKYPCIKCNKELWAEIKPVLESFGIDRFGNVFDDFINPNFNDYPFLSTNYGNYKADIFRLGLLENLNIDNNNASLRYLVNTKEEFLSVVAKLLDKEYISETIFDGVDNYTETPPTVLVDKQNIKDVPEPIAKYDFTKADNDIIPNQVVKYPCIKCTQQLYDKIKDILINIGYKEFNVTDFKEEENLLTINVANVFGQVSNVRASNIKNYNRYECSDIREFLTKVCELKGFKVYYIDFIGDNDAENHVFDFTINEENKSIEIHENGKKKFKKKKERYVVSCDPAIGKDSTVVTTILAKGNDFDKDKEDMEKINIANKLKYCKKGTKLYSPIFGEVEFENIDDKIEVIVHTDKEEICKAFFEKDGRYYISYKDAECLLFPSKDNRDWNNFQVIEEGYRVMCSNDGMDWFLYNYFKTNVACCISDENIIDSWKYIVPVEEFDFLAEDITINKEKSIV